MAKLTNARSLLYGAVLLLSMFVSGCGQPAKLALPVAVLQSPYGEIHIELDVKNAPISAYNFIAYAQGGHLQNLSFYRTVTHQNDNHELKISVLQGGVNGNFDESFVPALAPIAHESSLQTGLLNVRGAIALARAELGSAHIEFFVSTANNPHLDAGGLRHPDGQGFAVFGKVVKGMDIIDTIAALPANKAHSDAYVKNQILDEQVPITHIVIMAHSKSDSQTKVNHQ